MGYAEDIAPYARKAAAGTGLPVSVILAQWWSETAWKQPDGRWLPGTNPLVRGNNHGGIKYVGQAEATAGRQGQYAAYRTVDDFVRDYIRVIRLPLPGYTRAREVAAAWRRGEVTVEDVARSLAASEYAEGGYSGGNQLISLIRENNLTRFDSPLPAGGGLPAVTVSRIGDQVVVAGAGLATVGLVAALFLGLAWAFRDDKQEAAI